MRFGLNEWKSASTLHVSELPVGTWTNESSYKEFLEKWQEGAGKYKSGQVLNIKSNHTDTKVSFTVKLAPQFAATLTLRADDSNLSLKRLLSY